MPAACIYRTATYEDPMANARAPSTRYSSTGASACGGLGRRCSVPLLTSARRTHPCRLDVFGKTEAAGQRGVGEEDDLLDLAAAQGEHHHAPGLRAQVVAEGRLAVR